jgi:hypothetical protein
MRIGIPRRHLPRRHRLPDRAGPGPRVLVGEKGEWRHLAGPMAVRALLVDDRRDVPGERDVACGRSRVLSRRCVRKRRGRDERDSPADDQPTHNASADDDPPQR